MAALGTLVPLLFGVVWLTLAAVIAFRPRAAGALLSIFPSKFRTRLAFTFAATIGGLFLVAGAYIPFLCFFTASVTAILAAAFLVGTGIGPRRRYWPVPAFLLIGSVLAAVAQPLGLKVLMLPRADSLEYTPVPAAVAAKYEEGVWLESVRAGRDGTLYVSANRDLDFARSDYYHSARGEVIKRTPDGSDSVVFKTPLGSTAGVIAVSADGTLYMTSNGATAGIWRILPDGTGTRLTDLPPGAWPNGIDFGPDEMLYSADSNLGLVWRIDPASGRAEIAVKSPILSARPFVALAPGANGLHFQGRDMIVTVSDSTSILRFRMNAESEFSAPEAVTSGIPGDDFAIGRDGSLFVTTHPYNTVVRIAPDGTRSVIADARDGVTGAVDAVFGNTELDRDTLYVATDGGAFSGDPKTRGSLIALQPYAKE